jgi:hypothetical protein
VYPECSKERRLRITVSHNRPPEEVKQAVDRSLDDIFKGILVLPVQLLQEQRAWQGNKLNFSLIAKMGVVSTPIKGTIEITDRDIAIDVNLGVLERLVPASKVREVFGERIKGRLK